MAWRALVASPSAPAWATNFVFALTIAAAAAPFAGWRTPVAWALLMSTLIGAEALWLRRAAARQMPVGRFNLFAWLASAGYSVAALYLVFFHAGAAQTLGVTLYGVVLFQILARDYTTPRRLLANLIPPVLSMVAVQAAAMTLLIQRGVPWQVITLLASPYVVFRAFRAVQQNLNRSREQEREALAQLGDSEARYRVLAEKSPDVIVRYDVRGQVEYLSPAARAYGWDPDNLAGVNVAAGLDPEELDRNAAFLADLAAGRPVPQAEDNVWKVCAKNGRSVLFEGRSSAILSDDGRVTGAVSILRDVTERKALEAELAASAQKLRGLFELAPVGIALTDMDGRYVEFNKAFGDICGYEEAELKSLGYWDLTPQKYADDEADQLAALHATGRYGPYEKEYIRKDGSLIPLRLNGMLVEGASGRPYIWSIVEDISEQRRTQAVLIEARRSAEAAAQAKSEFLANMSHEIRTPLTAVVGFAGLLKDMDRLPDGAAHYADRIATSAETLLLVVNDVLDFSKLEAGKVELDPQAFGPADFVEATADLMRGRAAEKGLPIEVRLAPDLPAGLCADSARLRQVLLNLLTNAVKFTEAGAVTIEAGYRDEVLRIAVRDTGIGITPEAATNLFQRFSQVDASSTRQHGGTGLGLAISQSIVELMGGRIGMESAPGAGSTFWFEVPAKIAAKPEAARAEPEAELQEAAHTRILVVDDVAVNRELICAILGAFDVSIVEAASGAEAVKASLSAPFDVILMDLQMPGMDGMAATQAIRANSDINRATPILAISANVLPAQVEACLKAGMNDHIAKPISPTDLITKISRWTSQEAGKPDQAVGVRMSA